jgi:hypothetical protein
MHYGRFELTRPHFCVGMTAMKLGFSGSYCWVQFCKSVAESRFGSNNGHHCVGVHRDIAKKAGLDIKILYCTALQIL